MSITKHFKRFILLRIAFVLFGVVLGSLPYGNAFAQSYSSDYCSPSNYVAHQCTREMAYAACMTPPDGYSAPIRCPLIADIRYERKNVDSGQWVGSYAQYWVTECPSGTSWDDNTKTCSCPSGQIKNSITGQCMQSCSSRSEFSESSTASTGQYIPNGSLGCNSGCMYVHYNNPDGTATGTYLSDESYDHCVVIPTCDMPGWYFSTGTGMCQPPKPECKANQTKDAATGECKDSCPSGMILGDDGQCEKSRNTCPAGQVQAPDGSCVQNSCPAGQTMGADGACKRDDDPDKDDGDSDTYFSGGDDCSSPPACSGDPIMCGQARIQWRIDCNTRHNTNVSGGSCAAMPVCTGEKCDAVEYASLIQQWRTACAVEKLAGGATGEGEQPSWTRVDGMSQDPGAGQTASDTEGVQTSTLSTSDVDSSGWLGGLGSCPALVSAPSGTTIGGSFAQALASPPSWFCNFVGAMAGIILLVASIAAATILARG